jgi:hypothetical protein
MTVRLVDGSKIPASIDASDDPMAAEAQAGRCGCCPSINIPAKHMCPAMRMMKTREFPSA